MQRLTNTKQVALQQEYDNLQHYLQTREDRGLYLANRQQVDRFYKLIKKTTEYQNVIAIDMGIKHIATSVELATNNNRTVFYGKDLNHVRGWYFWLRRQLGLKKAIDSIKKIGHHEKRIVNDIIHKITRQIVNRAIQTDSLIVLGKLKGLRNQEKKGGRRRGKKV